MPAAQASIDDCAARRFFVVRRAAGAVHDGGFSGATPGDASAPRPAPSPPRPGILRLPGKAIRTLREDGPKAVLSKTRAALGSGGAVVVYELQREQVVKRGSGVPGVTVQILDEGDIAAYAALRPNSEEAVAERLRRGDCCIAAWDEGRVVGARWFTTARADVGDVGVSFPLLSEIAYAYDAFTAPEERGRGIGAMVTAALFECATAAGSTRLINAVLPENPSGQGLARRRSKPLGMVRSNRLLDWLIVRCQLPPGYLGAPLPFGSPRSRC